MVPRSSFLGARRSAAAVGAAALVAALLWFGSAPVQAQQNDQPDRDSAAAPGNRNATDYRYSIQNGPGQNAFRLEIKQASPGTPPVVTVNGERVELDSAGSKRIDLPNGGHITISQGANGQVQIQDGGPHRLFAFGGDLDSLFADGDFTKNMQQAQRELARVQQEFSRMWREMPGGGATIQTPGVCVDTTSKTGAER